MQAHVRNIDLERQSIDLARALDIEITLENGQRFKVSERDGMLNIRTEDGRLVLLPSASNDVLIRQEPHF